MNAVELKVLEVKKPEVLFNETEISNYLAGVLETYDGLVFTDESVKDCKTTVTELNKMIKSVEDFRKKYKKELSEPISAFEEQCKRLVMQIENVQSPLKLQYEAFEQKRKDDRRVEVEGFIQEVVSLLQLEDKYSVRLALKDEWLNSSLSNPKCKKSIAEEGEKLLSEQKSYYDKLELINTKCELYSLKHNLQIALTPDSFHYMLDTHDGFSIESKIFNVAERQAETEKEAIERIRKQEEAKANAIAQAAAQVEIDKAKEEANVKVTEALEVAATVAAQVDTIMPVEESADAKMYKATYSVRGTKNQLIALQEYMAMVGIQFTKL